VRVTNGPGMAFGRANIRIVVCLHCSSRWDQSCPAHMIQITIAFHERPWKIILTNSHVPAAEEHNPISAVPFELLKLIASNQGTTRDSSPDDRLALRSSQEGLWADRRSVQASLRIRRGTMFHARCNCLVHRNQSPSNNRFPFL
jgi:hypothetical protein